MHCCLALDFYFSGQDTAGVWSNTVQGCNHLQMACSCERLKYDKYAINFILCIAYCSYNTHGRLTCTVLYHTLSGDSDNCTIYKIPYIPDLYNTKKPDRTLQTGRSRVGIKVFACDPLQLETYSPIEHSLVRDHDTWNELPPEIREITTAWHVQETFENPFFTHSNSLIDDVFHSFIYLPLLYSFIKSNWCQLSCLKLFVELL